jgi:hypothetical protein
MTDVNSTAPLPAAAEAQPTGVFDSVLKVKPPVGK